MKSAIFLLHRTFRSLAIMLVCLLSSVTPNAGADGSVILTNLTSLPNGGIRLQALGPTGMVYSLQGSPDLRDWRTLDFSGVDNGEAAFQDDSAATLRARFYRVRLDPPGTTTWITNYHGWSNSIIVSNNKVEAVIVPAIGRLMQLRFVDQDEGPFWENTKMYGKQPTANQWDTPGAFGGDKAWPAPQSVWNWPPPRGFDSLSFTGAVANGVVNLIGPVDSTFGTRVVRRIALHPTEPLMRVTTTFEKVTGKTNQMSVWVVTQVKEAERIFVPVSDPSAFAKGYTALGTVPKGLLVTNGLVSLARDRSTSCKIGNDAGALLWVGTNAMLLIESARVPGMPRTSYPDSGCSAEVYTNPDPTPYIELELLGPLAKLGPGQTLEATSVYTLLRRSEPTALEEAMRILRR
jgi:hypothetical protein